MSFVDTILFHLVLTLFPMLLYLFYVAYHRKLSTSERDLFLDLALLTSLYLNLHYGSSISNLILHIPLLIAYVKGRYLVAFMNSIFLLLSTSSPIFSFACVEYLLYFFLSFLNLKRKNSHLFEVSFLLLKTVFYLSSTFSLKGVLSCMIFYIIAFFTFFLFKKGEEIIKFHMNLKELEKEKQIRASLFKITHEIKNPIAVCKGYLDMFDVENKEHAKKYIPIMKEEIDRTLNLLQDFLCMTKIQMKKDILDINYLIEEVIANFEPILKEKNIALELSLAEDEIDVMGDYNRLCQVLINLIKNGIEAMESGGTLSVFTKEKNGKVEIEIQDTGSGIPKNVLEKMKEPFYTTKKNGTGLGVSLSDEIIKGHFGTLRYFSEYGKGTTAFIRLPIYEMS